MKWLEGDRFQKFYLLLIVDKKGGYEYFGVMVAQNVGNISAEQLDKMVEDGGVVLAEVMRGQWELKMGKKVIGEVNTDSLKGEHIVSVGGRELARFTAR